MQAAGVIHGQFEGLVVEAADVEEAVVVGGAGARNAGAWGELHGLWDDVVEVADVELEGVGLPVSAVQQGIQPSLLEVKPRDVFWQIHANIRLDAPIQRIVIMPIGYIHRTVRLIPPLNHRPIIQLKPIILIDPMAEALIDKIDGEVALDRVRIGVVERWGEDLLLFQGTVEDVGVVCVEELEDLTFYVFGCDGGDGEGEGLVDRKSVV